MSDETREEREARRAKARDRIRSAYLAGESDRLILDSCKALGITRAQASADLELAKAQCRHEELTAERYRAMLHDSMARSRKKGDEVARLKALEKLDALDAATARERARRARITDVQSLVEAVRRGDVDEYRAVALRPLLELDRAQKASEENADRYAEMSIEELGKEYAARMGGRR